MDSLSHCETNGLGRRSSIVAPTKLLRCFSILHAISNVGLLERSCNMNEIVVTGLNLPQLHYEYSSINDDPHAHIHKEISNCLQHPDYSYRTNRRKSFKHWDGLFPPRELVEAGFYMVARNLVRCFSCNVLVHVLDWKRGDDVVDKHYQCSPNCGFVKELLNGVVSGIPNHHSCSEKPLIKVRVKKEGSSVNTLSITNKTEHPSSVMPNNVCKDHLVTTIHHQPSQQSVSTDGQLPKSSTKSTDPIMYSSPREQIVLSERLCEVPDDDVGVGTEEGRIVPKCKRCHVQPVEYIFLPCGDAKTCEGCAREVFNSGQPCFVCNQLVATVHPVYL